MCASPHISPLMSAPPPKSSRSTPDISSSARHRQFRGATSLCLYRLRACSVSYPSPSCSFKSQPPARVVIAITMHQAMPTRIVRPRILLAVALTLHLFPSHVSSMHSRLPRHSRRALSTISPQSPHAWGDCPPSDGYPAALCTTSSVLSQTMASLSSEARARRAWDMDSSRFRPVILMPPGKARCCRWCSRW